MKIVEFEGKKKSEAELMIEDANRMRREQDRARVFEAVALALINAGHWSPDLADEMAADLIKTRDEFAKQEA